MSNFKTALQNLSKGIRNLSVKGLDPYIAEGQVLVPDSFRNNPGNPGWFFGPNGVDYRFTFTDSNSAFAAYQTCAPLSAIINREAQAYINGKTFIMDSTGKESKTSDANKIRTLLAKPNPLRSWLQFEAEQYINIKVFDFCVCLPIAPYGYSNNKDASSIWNIPSYMLTVKPSKKIFYNQTEPSAMFESVIFNAPDGEKVELDLEKIFIFRDFVPSMNNVFLPGSRLQALSMPINNIITALEIRNELMNYAGAQGVLTPLSDIAGPIPLKQTDKDQLQADFKRQYGIKRGQSRYIISPSAVNWLPMGKPTKDLLLFEEIQDDIMRLCDGLNFPYRLLSSEKSASYNDVHEFERIFYQDTIIPESLDYYNQWNSFFSLDPSKLSIVKDYSHIACISSDAVEDGKAALDLNNALLIEFQNNQITWNEWRASNDRDTVNGMDKYYYQLIAEGWTFGAAATAPAAESMPTDNNKMKAV